MTILRDLLFYAMLGLPVLAVIVFFIVSLVMFLKAPKNSPERKTRKILLIVSSVILGLFVLTILGFAMFILSDLLFYAMFGLPVLAAIAFFIVSLVLFKKAPKDSPQRKTRKVLLIVSSVLLGVIVLAVVGFAVMFTMAIMFM